jgi:hypothetical protein
VNRRRNSIHHATAGDADVAVGLAHTPISLPEFGTICAARNSNSTAGRRAAQSLDATKPFSAFTFPAANRVARISRK